jgi:hypothetical protein
LVARTTPAADVGLGSVATTGTTPISDDDVFALVDAGRR